jgi:hypothetical protein
MNLRVSRILIEFLSVLLCTHLPVYGYRNQVIAKPRVKVIFQRSEQTSFLEPIHIFMQSRIATVALGKETSLALFLMLFVVPPVAGLTVNFDGRNLSIDGTLVGNSGQYEAHVSSMEVQRILGKPDREYSNARLVRKVWDQKGIAIGIGHERVTSVEVHLRKGNPKESDLFAEPKSAFTGDLILLGVAVKAADSIRELIPKLEKIGFAQTSAETWTFRNAKWEVSLTLEEAEEDELREESVIKEITIS